jgi:hypothetical protein
MTMVSARGWRRDEPGLIKMIEQPSLLPRAVELLGQEGIPESTLIRQCRVPTDLFHTVTARVPRTADAEALVTDSNVEANRRRVVSLLPRLPADEIDEIPGD